MIRRSTLALCLALSPWCGVQATSLPDQPPARAESLEEPDASGAVQRQAAISRLAPALAVHREVTSPEACIKQVQTAYAVGAYQVFVERHDAAPALAPLAFSVTLRENVDIPRLTPVCQVGTALIVTRFNDAVRRSQDPDVQHDYVIALLIADWAQAKAEGRTSGMMEIPPDIVLDPFQVLGSPSPAL